MFKFKVSISNGAIVPRTQDDLDHSAQAPNRAAAPMCCNGIALKSQVTIGFSLSPRRSHRLGLRSPNFPEQRPTGPYSPVDKSTDCSRDKCRRDCRRWRSSGRSRPYFQPGPWVLDRASSRCALVRIFVSRCSFVASETGLAPRRMRMGR
jgi:hypothetical protein